VAPERTSRSARVILPTIDPGGDVTGNGISKLVFTILSALVEAERDRIRERVTQVKRDQRQRNRYLGGIVRFGFRVGNDGGLVPDEAEQAWSRRLVLSARAVPPFARSRPRWRHTEGSCRWMRLNGCLLSTSTM
jgi:DNA invertase Pin-like site-specific DNA recombinase